MDKARAYLQDMVRYPTLLGTVVINFIPFLGVLFWGWGVGALVVLYWLENVVVGFITILRMTLSAASSAISLASLAFIVPFFCLHYGLFCFVHGVFVLVLAGMSGGLEAGAANVPVGAIDEGPLGVFNAAMSTAPGVPLMLAIIGGWRLILTLFHYVLRGAYRTSNPMEEMGKPYGRIITLHFAIFAGAFGLFWLGEPAWGMFGLIALKAAFDFFGVRKEAKGETGQAKDALKTREAYAALEQALKARISKGRPPSS
jgi:hypothetical protein